MDTLRSLYLALASFGGLVLIADLAGAFGRLGDSAGGSAEGEADMSGAHDDGGNEDAGAEGHDGGGDAEGGAADHDEGGSGPSFGDQEKVVLAALGAASGAATAPGERGLRRVAGLFAFLRSAEYFALGAGATGLFGLRRGLGAAAGLAWALGAGLGLALLARAVRSLARKELDSTWKPEEFILEEARVTVPIAPGMIGKAAARRYGAEVEFYVRARDPAAAFARGERVRLIDYADGGFLVEAADEEHLVR